MGKKQIMRLGLVILYGLLFPLGYYAQEKPVPETDKVSSQEKSEALIKTKVSPIIEKLRAIKKDEFLTAQEREQKIEKLLAEPIVVEGCPFELGCYDADNETFPVIITVLDKYHAWVQVSRSVARDFKEHLDKLTLQVELRVSRDGKIECVDGVIEDQVNGKKYVFQKSGIIPKRGLLAYWKFDEASGIIAKDSSGNGNHALIHGAKRVNGKAGRALSFDGVDDYVESIAIQERSVVMWIKPAKREHMDFYDSGIRHQQGQAYVLAIYEPGSILGQHTFNTTTYGLFLVFWGPDIAVPYNKIKSGWHHIAISWDGKVTVRIGMDGKFPDGYVGYPTSKQAQPFTLNKQPRPNANATTMIGRATEQIMKFNGLIDEVKLYDRALSEEEIKADYKKSK